MKVLEHPAELLRRQANAGVGDGRVQQHGVRRALAHAQRDAYLAPLSELDGVGGVVDKDLAHAPGVTHQHLRHICSNVELQRQAFCCGLLAHKTFHPCQHAFQPERRAFDIQLARLALGKVQDVSDQTQQMLA